MSAGFRLSSSFFLVSSAVTMIFGWRSVLFCSCFLLIALEAFEFVFVQRDVLCFGDFHDNVRGVLVWCERNVFNHNLMEWVLNLPVGRLGLGGSDEGVRCVGECEARVEAGVRLGGWGWPLALWFPILILLQDCNFLVRFGKVGFNLVEFSL